MRWNCIVLAISKEWKNKLVKLVNIESKDLIEVEGIYIHINNKFKRIERVSSKKNHTSYINRKMD